MVLFLFFIIEQIIKAFSSNVNQIKLINQKNTYYSKNPLEPMVENAGSLPVFRTTN